MPTLASIQIGRPEQLDADTSQPLSQKPWRTAFYKKAVLGSIKVGTRGIDGDGQADMQNHGGVDKAVCVYSVRHFDYWKTFLNRDDVVGGAFGENFSVEGLDESNVAIGDRWTIGDAVFEVSQPRQPCWKLARRWQSKRLTVETIKTGKTGWYLRTIQTGTIQAGDEIIVRAVDQTSHRRFSIENANDIFYRKQHDHDAQRQLSATPQLSESWRSELDTRLTSR